MSEVEQTVRIIIKELRDSLAFAAPELEQLHVDKAVESLVDLVEQHAQEQ